MMRAAAAMLLVCPRAMAQVPACVNRGTVVDVTVKGNARVERPVLRASDFRLAEERVE